MGASGSFALCTFVALHFLILLAAGAIGHLWVLKTLTFKTRLSVKTFFMRSLICIRIKIHFRINGFALSLLWNRGLGQLGNSLLDNCAVEVRITAVLRKSDLYFWDEIFAPEKLFKKGCLASLLHERILQYGHSNQTSYSALNTLRGCNIETGFCDFSWNLTGEVTTFISSQITSQNFQQILGTWRIPQVCSKYFR